jgi:hypothetical protein
MWGNKQGWIISAALVVIMTAVLGLLARADHISAPTDFVKSSGVLDPLPPIAAMARVLPMDQEGDAATAYRKAIASYHQNERKYEAFAESTKTDPQTLAPLIEGLTALKEGTRLNKLTLFTHNPKSVINYDSTATDLPAIENVALAACRLGLLLKDEKPKEAMALFEAAFGAGAKLFNERVTWDECRTGMGLMGSSAGYIGKLSAKAGNSDRAAAVATFEEARLALYKDKLAGIATALTTVDPRVMSRYAGDIFVVAEQSQERMWRVEAIRKLGIMRYANMVNKRAADELTALRRVQKYAKDPDPVIAAAGEAASTLTMTGFRTLR